MVLGFHVLRAPLLYPEGRALVFDMYNTKFDVFTKARYVNVW